MTLKHYGRLITVGVLMTSSITAMGGECGDFPVAFFKTTQNNQHQEWGISLPLSIMSSEPEWLSGKVPLDINQTRDIVTAWAGKTLSQYDAVHVNSYHLRPYECPTLPNRWFYIVDVIPTIDGHEVPSATQSVAVTFEGKVIKASPSVK